ncbi:VOC family protein [Microbacterium sp. zg-Y818]|uniref:VOC family protein n=1 Tax=unclassified Microbacterium TaxID=2609290 RepID=UPI00214CBF87|nr:MULTISPECIES: VOC family protein [unclassified Microbacterium]MCR2802116.1 VOC family protein [Microbacterium sp. zg.Y818]WIM22664.1 VOC family protein [Microbacterium sp. zg-Y818]
MTISPELTTGITRDIYGMPAFVTLIVPDVRAAASWFTEALDFIELFALPPGDAPTLIHLRRWRYQDLLIRGASDADAVTGGIQLSLAADYDELDDLTAKARAQDAEVEGPTDTAWNTRDLSITTPQGLRLVFTARRPEPLRDEAFTADMRRWNAEQSERATDWGRAEGRPASA